MHILSPYFHKPDILIFFHFSLELINKICNNKPFSISKEFQSKRLGKILLKKLAESSRENGISDLFAYTFPENKAMTKLFNTLPYKVTSVLEDNKLLLSCRFDNEK